MPDHTADDTANGGPILPGTLRLAIYLIGTPVGAACAFLGAAGEGILDPGARLIVGTIGAAAGAAVGLTAAGSWRR